MALDDSIMDDGRNIDVPESADSYKPKDNLGFKYAQYFMDRFSLPPIEDQVGLVQGESLSVGAISEFAISAQNGVIKSGLPLPHEITTCYETLSNLLKNDTPYAQHNANMYVTRLIQQCHDHLDISHFRLKWAGLETYGLFSGLDGNNNGEINIEYESEESSHLGVFMNMVNIKHIGNLKSDSFNRCSDCRFEIQGNIDRNNFNKGKDLQVIIEGDIFGPAFSNDEGSSIMVLGDLLCGIMFGHKAEFSKTEVFGDCIELPFTDGYKCSAYLFGGLKANYPYHKEDNRYYLKDYSSHEQLLRHKVLQVYMMEPNYTSLAQNRLIAHELNKLSGECN